MVVLRGVGGELKMKFDIPFLLAAPNIFQPPPPAPTPPSSAEVLFLFSKMTRSFSLETLAVFLLEDALSVWTNLSKQCVVQVFILETNNKLSVC